MTHLHNKQNKIFKLLFLTFEEKNNVTIKLEIQSKVKNGN